MLYRYCQKVNKKLKVSKFIKDLQLCVDNNLTCKFNKHSIFYLNTNVFLEGTACTLINEFCGNWQAMRLIKCGALDVNAKDKNLQWIFLKFVFFAFLV